MKHPEVRFRPPELTKVEVAVVKFATLPIAKREPGVEVAMPTLPPFVIAKSVDDAESMTLNALPVGEVDAQTVSLAKSEYGVVVGVEVPIETLEVRAEA